LNKQFVKQALVWQDQPPGATGCQVISRYYQVFKLGSNAGRNLLPTKAGLQVR